jgi:hypothetical protein
MGHEVKGSRNIKIDSISLTLTTDCRGHNVKEWYQISNSGFGFGEAMLVGFNFNVMRNMIVNNEFK